MSGGIFTPSSKNKITAYSSIFQANGNSLEFVKYVWPFFKWDENKKNLCQLATFAKGQLILKCLFGVFTFFQKTNENKACINSTQFPALKMNLG